MSDFERDFFDKVITSRNDARSLLEHVNEEWKGEDGLYRFYHNSYKVFYIKNQTSTIVEFLRGLSDLEFNVVFQQIIDEGQAKEFGKDTNRNWLSETRPCLEAFFHARAMLELVVKYGDYFHANGADKPPNLLPTGWGTLLYLFNLR